MVTNSDRSFSFSLLSRRPIENRFFLAKLNVFYLFIYQAIQGEISKLESQLASVSEQIKEDDNAYLDLMPVKQRVSALTQRCSALRKDADERMVKLERIVKELTTFVQATGELRVYLKGAFEKLESLEPIHNDAEVIQQQLKEVQVSSSVT